MTDSFGDGNVLVLDCSNANFHIVILCCSFAKHSHWGKLGKEHMGFLHYFLQLPVNLQLSKNKKFNFLKNAKK